MRLARNVQTAAKTGMCGLTTGPAYPHSKNQTAPPLPPPAVPPRPPLPPVTHYGDPGEGGCLVDEIMGQIPGIEGKFCAPECPANTVSTQAIPVATTWFDCQGRC